MKIYRKKEGLSQAALAEKSGSAPNYIALIEAGKKFPSLSMLEKIAAALNIDALDLFDKNSLLSINTECLKTKLIDSLTNLVTEIMDDTSIIEKD